MGTFLDLTDLYVYFDNQVQQNFGIRETIGDNFEVITTEDKNSVKQHLNRCLLSTESLFQSSSF